MRLAQRCAGAALLLAGACTTLDDKLGDKDWYQQARTTSSKATDYAGDKASRFASSAGDTASRVVAAAPDTTAKAAATASDAAAKAATVAADRTAKAAVRMKQYLAEKDVLQTFHDASEHGEGSVLDLLHTLGVGGSRGAIAKPAAVARSADGNGADGKVAATKGADGKSADTKGANARGVDNKATDTKAAVASQPPALPEEYTGIYRWPLDAGIVSSEYGERWGNVHKGIDIAAHTGEPVYAIADGDVIYASDGLRGYGNVVILRHDRQRTTLYAHNSALKVKAGDRVKQGELVSLLGSTGHSTGPHVHFEIREGDKALDPRGLLPKGKFALAGAGNNRAPAAAK